MTSRKLEPIGVYKFNNDILIIKPKGELGLHIYDAFDKEISKLVETNSDKNLLLDMSEVTSLSSSTFRVLVSTSRRVTANGKKFKLYGFIPMCKHIVDLVNLDKLIDIYDNDEQAFKSLARED